MMSVEEEIEAELEAVERDMHGWKPKHRNCGGACHRCPDLGGEIMPGCYGGMYALDGCYCRPNKMRVQHPRCPSCRCPVVEAGKADTDD